MMVSINSFLIQLFQPYFFYSLIFLTFAFVSLYLFLKFNSIPHKYQSIVWLLPLFIPLLVFFVFPPQSGINIAPFTIQNTATLSLHDLGFVFAGANIFSITGIICISGIVVAIGYISLLLAFGKALALRRFHVVMMEDEEYPKLQQQVKKIAQKLKIAQPKVGLVDDLVPNAFTTGYGRNAVIVFSLGLLEMLDSEELTAVISHELAHIKSKDYLFKTLSNGLNILSFFNPLAYFASSHAKKERELLADEKGAASLSKPIVMANVLIKIESVINQFPKAPRADQFSASLFLVTSLAHKPGVLASHPELTQRVMNIHASGSKDKKPRHVVLTILLLAILISTATITVYSTVSVQRNLPQVERNLVLNGGLFLLYNSTVPSNITYPYAILGNETLRYSSSSQYDNLTTDNAVKFLSFP